MRLLVCPHCQNQLNCTDEAGVEVVCGTCGGKFRTPEAAASAGFDFSPQDQAPLGNQDLIRELRRQTTLLQENFRGQRRRWLFTLMMHVVLVILVWYGVDQIMGIQYFLRYVHEFYTELPKMP
tara:strand:+ start:589 stop:957 length:369 start_codon:yes stop_codon:yes gene_type:complete